ncbi:hypothetical protein CC78DRAFT_252419 [Lojkania enalia]|uniref:Uncharacterized protein n=1 Tax=Lojkania enalia TaxID=147567 RepID=A0A9P4K908_9PLEO|nr:hypothetical protein CC78DRAFT_252419 [Didymosphaeria enalia]
MQYFAPHFQPGPQTTHSLRAGQYKPSRKRKRDENTDEPPISPDIEAKNSAASSNAQSHSSFGSLEPTQLRIAGLLPEDAFEIPAPPFPHAPARARNDNFSSAKLQQELTSLGPPLFAVNATSKSNPIGRKSERPTLRQTHLGVLTTILHHCLLKGDYSRAGRAWGMILRTQLAGIPIDPRNHARWGLGAEILLRRNHPNSSNHSEGPQNKQYFRHTNDIYTEEGFERAREYYERLIVQHPNRKHIPNATDDRTFYPAMFSLWIYEVCERSKRAWQQYKDGLSKTNSETASINEDTTLSSSFDASAQLYAIKVEELRRGRELADRLEQLIISPPFDKHADMLQLRGMVGLWLGDLILAADPSKQKEDRWELNASELLDEESDGDVRTIMIQRYEETGQSFSEF